jgi:rare lipoprotein A
MRVDRADRRSEFSSQATLKAAIRIAGVTCAALAVANCSQAPQKTSSRTVDPKYGVYASPRVVADGQPVPKGGGREIVGKPYQVAGQTYAPRHNPNYSRVGTASWYGSAFHGRLTANGEIFDRDSVAAAHPTMPLPSYARVTNLRTQRSMIVRVNDRGPYHGNRLIDVSERAAEALGFRHHGTAQVRVDYVGRASTNGSDDRLLMATLRTDGSPATLSSGRVMVAEAPAAPSAPRESIAFRSTEQQLNPVASFFGWNAAPAAAPAPSRVASTVPVAAPATAAVSAPAPVRVANVPLPPERPFDLGTIPQAASPVRANSLAMLPPARPVTAGLY